MAKRVDERSPSRCGPDPASWRVRPRSPRLRRGIFGSPAERLDELSASKVEHERRDRLSTAGTTTLDRAIAEADSA